MKDEEWIEHEVQLRVNTKEHIAMNDLIARIDAKLNWLIGIVVTSIITVALHSGGYL